jgi:ATP-dependent Clp protease ATP-binding subunit ClpA
MIAQELEVSLHMAFVEARQKRHEFITVEHLLLALLDNPSAAEVLRACAANIDVLRKELADVHQRAHANRRSGSEEIDTQPTLGFQRVIQRAILHVQSSGKKEVTGANVLVAIFGEKDSHAVYFPTASQCDASRYRQFHFPWNRQGGAACCGKPGIRTGRAGSRTPAGKAARSTASPRISTPRH